MECSICHDIIVDVCPLLRENGTHASCPYCGGVVSAIGCPRQALHDMINKFDGVPGGVPSGYVSNPAVFKQDYRRTAEEKSDLKDAMITHSNPMIKPVADKSVQIEPPKKPPITKFPQESSTTRR